MSLVVLELFCLLKMNARTPRERKAPDKLAETIKHPVFTHLSCAEYSFLTSFKINNQKVVSYLVEDSDNMQSFIAVANDNLQFVPPNWIRDAANNIVVPGQLTSK